MGKDKLVTVDQLHTVAAKLKEAIDSKPSGSSDAEFTSVTLGNLTLTASLDGRLQCTDDQDNTGNVIIDSTADQNVSVNVLTVDRICDYHTNISGSARTVYSLPYSTAASKLASLDASVRGGGIVLTSRYRAYDMRVDGVNAESSKSIGVRPYIYTTIVCEPTADTLGIELLHNPDTVCDEWWIDVNFLPSDDNDNQESAEPIRVVLRDGWENIHWANDEAPDWSQGYTRIRIHVLYDIASFETLSSLSSVIS